MTADADVTPVEQDTETAEGAAEAGCAGPSTSRCSPEGPTVGAPLSVRRELDEGCPRRGLYGQGGSGCVL